MDKTNSMRLLDSRKVPYKVHTFSAEIRSATEVAEILGLPPQQVYKTLVVLRPKGKPLLAVIAADRELDLKLLAQELGEKKLAMSTHAEAEALTGLQVGGISALSLLNKGFDVYLDRPAQALDEFLVSAGQRGINLQLPVKDYIRVTRARLVQATSAPEP